MSHMVTPGSREGRLHLSRALIEGIAFSARANAEQIAGVTGTEAVRFMAAGGMTRSELWTQILSDILGRPLEVPSTCEVTSLGAAICAGAGAGVFAVVQANAKTEIVSTSRRTGLFKRTPSWRTEPGSLRPAG